MKIVTADNLRDQAGKTAIIKASQHEGVLRRPTEVVAKLDDFSPQTGKGPLDFFKEKAERERLEKEKGRLAERSE